MRKVKTPSQEQTVREFFLTRYPILVASVSALSVVVVLLTLKSQIQATTAIYGQKITKVVELNKNELLNEIALDDLNALQEHLRIILEQTEADEINLTMGSREVIVKNPQSLGRWISFSDPINVAIANDFGSFAANLRVDFSQSIFNSAIYPMLKLSLIVLFCVLLLVTVISLWTFTKLNSRLIQPLKAIDLLIKDLRTKPTPVVVPETGLSEIQAIYRSLQEYQEIRNQAVVAEVAAQVAHDIRSPLAALASLSADIGKLPEEQRVLLRMAVSRIQDISSSLSRKSMLPTTMDRAPDNDITYSLPSLIESILIEKRTQFRTADSLQIVFERNERNYGVFSKVDAVEFKRILSNLINNAVEALDQTGRVEVHLAESSRYVELTVQDNGPGISPEQLPLLGKRGQSFEKSGGSGLGLYHARITLERWGGKFEIESKVGSGTRVKLLFPRSELPSWAVKEIALNPSGKVVIADDDPLIHKIWDDRFKTTLPEASSIQVLHVNSPEKLLELELTDLDVCLVDYEFLGSTMTGLDAIARLMPKVECILVSNRFEERKLVELCRKTGVRLLPKSEALFVPINFILPTPLSRVYSSHHEHPSVH